MPGGLPGMVDIANNVTNTSFTGQVNRLGTLALGIKNYRVDTFLSIINFSSSIKLHKNTILTASNSFTPASVSIIFIGERWTYTRRE